MAGQPLKLESFWTRRSGLLALAIAVFVFALNLLQDLFLASEGFSRWGIVAFSDVITGSIAGALFYQFAKNEKYKRELVRERMHTIAELNHHIRNALQVIKFWGAQHQNCSLDEIQVRLMKESVDRIEWALREVLPSYPGAPEEMLGDAPAEQILPHGGAAGLSAARTHPQEHRKPH
ncbi:MAG: hypothetical protein ACRD4F_10055 [Candidatus Angelobacter sp.]